MKLLLFESSHRLFSLELVKITNTVVGFFFCVCAVKKNFFLVLLFLSPKLVRSDFFFSFQNVPFCI